jgi:mannosidase alpha-like ER degradation enhancer 1
MPDYKGGLLPLAHDLGVRLLRAFRDVPSTSSGRASSSLPLAWVNLRHGIEHDETRDQCTAGIGTLLLEFGFLSHLSGDERFWKAADAAINRLWERKSDVTGLFGNTIDGKVCVGGWALPQSHA